MEQVLPPSRPSGPAPACAMGATLPAEGAAARTQSGAVPFRVPADGPDAAAAPRPVRLAGIEALRGAAATMVVLSHVAGHMDKAFGAPLLMRLFRSGHAGVDLFFVLSGFIILFVHGPDVGRPRRIGRYLGRRAGRVLPPYWVALAITLLTERLGGHGLPGVGRLLDDVALLPFGGEPLLSIAWTLKFEVVFYAVFAVLVLSRAAGLALLAAWSGWIVLAAATGLGTAAPNPLWGFYGIEFFMGMAAAALLPRVQRGLAPALTGAALFLVAYALEGLGRLEGGGVAARFAYGLPAALLVLGVAAAGREGRLRPPAALRLLGAASYSIYLFQFVMIGAAWQLWSRAGLGPGPGNGAALFTTLTVVALAGGLVMWRLVERPLMRRLHPRGVAATVPSPGR